MCISDCSRTINCNLISFNKLNNICRFYRFYLNDQKKLIKSVGFVLYTRSNSAYSLQGIQYKTLSVSCQVISLVLLPNNNIAAGCINAGIKIWSTTTWSSTPILEFSPGDRPNSLVILKNNYLLSGGYNGHN